MKRILCVLLCLAALGSLCACGGSGDNVTFSSEEEMKEALMGYWALAAVLEAPPEPTERPDPENMSEAEILSEAVKTVTGFNMWGSIGDSINRYAAELGSSVGILTETNLRTYYFEDWEQFLSDLENGVTITSGGRSIDKWNWRKGRIEMFGTGSYDVQKDGDGKYILVRVDNGEVYMTKMEEGAWN